MLNFQEGLWGSIGHARNVLKCPHAGAVLQSEVQSIAVLEGQKSSFLGEQAGNRPMKKLLFTTASKPCCELDAAVLLTQTENHPGPRRSAEREKMKDF